MLILFTLYKKFLKLRLFWFFFFLFFFNDTATTEIYTLSLHDALPICGSLGGAVPCVDTSTPEW